MLDYWDWLLRLLFSSNPRVPGLFFYSSWESLAVFWLRPLSLGLMVALFALSWLRPRMLIDPAQAGDRARLLPRLGSAGSIAILLVSVLSVSFTRLFHSLQSDPRADGAWFRVSVLAATAIVLAAAGLALRRENPPRPAGTILPRRSWFAFASPALLWCIAALALALVCTEAWQGVHASEPKPLHDATGGDRVLTNSGGAPPTAFGWENHGPSIIAVVLLLAVLTSVLAADAKRTFPAGTATSAVRQQRIVTARLLCLLALGGVLLGLGAIWINTWAPTSWYVRIIAGEDRGPGDMLVSEYWGLVNALRAAGLIAQAAGGALLLRLAVDCWRARRALARSIGSPNENGPSSADLPRAVETVG